MIQFGAAKTVPRNQDSIARCVGRSDPAPQKLEQDDSDEGIWLRTGCTVQTAAHPMLKPLPPDPDVDDAAPSDPELALCDYEHTITYLRLMDAAADGADWREVAQIVSHIGPDRARTCAPGV
jgi:hypothetical protein